MSLDQFYTNPEVAERLLSTLKEESLDIWLEPSAGSGSFYNLMPSNRLGYDLEPKCPGVIQQDFLTVDLPSDKKIIAVGNPPFGYRAQGAIEFFNACAKRCYKIAFIIPRSFRKAYIINQLNEYFHLVDEEVLDVGIFIGGAEKIRTVWQVWERREYKREKVVLPSSHPDFNIVAQGKSFDLDKADIAIRRTGYKSVGEIVFPEDATPITQYVFIQILNEDAIKIFENLDLSCAFDTALAPTVTQGEIIQAYINQKAKNTS
tara:strand:+ start:713 stop:1495 length:783 start_codon:yes stop_codon:yes gene_type:complete